MGYHNKAWNTLSILFMRFISSQNIFYRSILTFNSLYEILTSAGRNNLVYRCCTFNSLYEIQNRCRPREEITGRHFQFSLWDSNWYTAEPKKPLNVNFQFSLWDSYYFNLRTANFLSFTFNSLYEIQNIKYNRYCYCIYNAFNSLYEIHSYNCKCCRFAHFTFNSLYEIPTS